MKKGTVFARSGEGAMHQVLRLRTKVSDRGGRAEPPPQSLTQKTIRQNPFSVNTVWGIRSTCFKSTNPKVSKCLKY